MKNLLLLIITCFLCSCSNSLQSHSLIYASGGEAFLKEFDTNHSSIYYKYLDEGQYSYYDQYSYNHNNQFSTNNDYEIITFPNHPNMKFLQNNLYPTKP